MWEEIFNLAINNGIWAVLFLALLIYQLKDSRAREEKYQKTIYSLSATLSTISDVKDNTKEISDKVKKIDKNVVLIKKNITPTKKQIKLCEVKNEN